MNRRSAIKGLGFLAGAVFAAPHLIGSHADPVGVVGLQVGDIITNPRTGEKMIVTSVNGINIGVNRMYPPAAGDRLLA